MKRTFLLLILTGLPCTCAWGQAVSMSCKVAASTSVDADTAYQHGDYAKAGTMYRAALGQSHNNDEAIQGLVRSELALDEVDKALADAALYDTGHASNSMAQALLAEVHLRMGEMPETLSYVKNAVKLNACNAWAAYQASRYLQLAGMFASARAELKTAHALAPDDAEITERWDSTTPMTLAEHLAQVNARLTEPGIATDEKKSLVDEQKYLQMMQKNDCHAERSIAPGKIPLVPMSLGAIQMEEDIYGAGIDAHINGKRQRLLVDTGATGILLGRAAAEAAGLKPEIETNISGFGDEGPKKGYRTHVDEIKLGGMTFKNCVVEVINTRDVVGDDGLISTDVFRNYLVTIDFPGREMRVDPLPLRQGEQAPPDALQSQGGWWLTNDAAPRDRSVPQEMKDWWPIYRTNHDLIVPATIGVPPMRLLILDSGSYENLVSPVAARRFSHTVQSWMTVGGLSGAVKKVSLADNVSISFAGVTQRTLNMTAFDLSQNSRDTEVEISAFAGFALVEELVISINYRDNLIHVVYDKNHGIHGYPAPIGTH